MRVYNLSVAAETNGCGGYKLVRRHYNRHLEQLEKQQIWHQKYLSVGVET